MGLEGMNNLRLIQISILFFTLTGLFGQTSIFWANNASNNIFRADLDGSDITPIRTGIDFVEDLTFNPVDNKIYLVHSDVNPGVETYVASINQDGSDFTILRDNLNSPDGLDLDLCAEKIYYAESGTSSISKMNFDGSDPEVVIAGAAVTVEGITLDVTGEKIYWVSSIAGEIYRANFDGTGFELVFSGLSGPLRLAKNMSTGVIYFTEFNSGRISRINADGSGYTVILSGQIRPAGIDLDLLNGHIYFSAFDGVSRMNLDGTGLINLVVDAGSKLSLTLNNTDKTCAEVEIVPTLGQWSLIILGLILFIFSVISFKQRASNIVLLRNS